MNQMNSDRGHQKLQEANVLSIKIGGDNAVNFQGNYELITKRSEAGKKQLIAISAFRRGNEFKTTDKLIEMGNKVDQGDTTWETKFEEILNFHNEVLRENIEPQWADEMLRCAAEEFTKFKAQIQEMTNKPKSEWKMAKLGEDLLLSSEGKHLSLTGFGEKVVEKLYHRYFELKGRTTTNLGEDEWMGEVLGDDAEKANRLKRSTLQKLRRAFKSRIKNALQEDSATVISGGYKPGVAFRRGYSDLAAAEMARAASELGYKTILGIEKQEPILTADPRLVGREKVKEVQEMPWKIAAELFGIKGAQAGAIHPDVMEVLEGAKVDIVVYDPKHSGKPSTWISEDCTKDPPVVAATKPIPGTVIVRGNMSNTSQVAARVLHELRELTLDQTYSGQNVWALTFNDKPTEALIEKLRAKLIRQFGKSFTVEVRENYSLVLAIGNNGRSDYEEVIREKGIEVPFKNGMMETATKSYVVDTKQAKAAVCAVHYVTHEAHAV